MKKSTLALGVICLSTVSFAKPDVKPKSLGGGFAQIPANSAPQTLVLDAVPVAVRHAAEVALAGYGPGYSLVGAMVDFEDVVAIYEVQATSADGRRIEVDVEANGRIEELEIQLRSEEIPAAVMDALSKHAPDFQPTQEEPLYEKSLRPSRNGLLEVWYEFGGKNFDVEIRSDAKAILIEPA